MLITKVLLSSDFSASQRRVRMTCCEWEQARKATDYFLKLGLRIKPDLTTHYGGDFHN